MSIGFIFWLIMLLWLLHMVAWRGGWITDAYGPLGNSVLGFILFFLLGWKVFGFIIHA